MTVVVNSFGVFQLLIFPFDKGLPRFEFSSEFNVFVIFTFFIVTYCAPFWPTCSCTRMKQNSFGTFLKTKRKSSSLQNTMNNTHFSKYLHLIYPSDFENNDTNFKKTALNLDLFLNINTNERFHTKIYDKRDDFNSQLSIFHSSAVTYPLLRRMVCTYLN